jgi:hypothetical protein
MISIVFYGITAAAALRQQRRGVAPMPAAPIWILGGLFPLDRRAVQHLWVLFGSLCGRVPVPVSRSWPTAWDPSPSAALGGIVFTLPGREGAAILSARGDED